MPRLLLVLCAGLTFLPQARPANSTVYIPDPFSSITAFNTKTWQQDGSVLPGGGNAFVLSQDGNTFYTAQSGCLIGCASVGYLKAIDRLTGRTLHTYQTEYAIWGGLAVLPNQSEIYVGTCSVVLYNGCVGGYVEVLDAASERSLAVISMGSDQVTQIAAAPNGATVYVTHFYNVPVCCPSLTPAVPPSARATSPAGTIGANQLTAIDVASLQVGASLGVSAENPLAVAITPDGQHAYFLAMEPYVSLGTVYGVNLADMTLEATIPLRASALPGASIAMSPDGSTLAAGAGGVMFIDTAKARVFRRVQGVAGPVISLDLAGNAYLVGNGIAIVNAWTGRVTSEIPDRSIQSAVFSPDGERIYLLSGNACAVAALEEAAVPRLLGIGYPPMWLAVSPDGQTLYSAEWEGGLWAVSTATGRATGRVLEDMYYVAAVAVSPDGNTLYVAVLESYDSPNTLMIVDAATGALVNTISLPACVSGTGDAIAITPAGDQVYVMGCGTTSVVNTATQTIAAEISGANGAAVAVSPTGNAVYMSTGGAAIDIVDPNTNEVTGSIPITASAIAFSPDGGKAYVISTQNSEPGVAVVDTSTLAVTGFVPGIVPLPVCGAYGCTGTGAGEGLAVTPDGNFIFVAGTPGAVIDTQTLNIVRQFNSGGPIVIH